MCIRFPERRVDLELVHDLMLPLRGRSVA
jgi:hypothetical protein